LGFNKISTIANGAFGGLTALKYLYDAGLGGPLVFVWIHESMDFRH
jgi:hypothetical protein